MGFTDGIQFFLFMWGAIFIWPLACLAACAIVVTSPIGALTCRYWARRHGLDVAACTRRGAFYWMAGFVPWLYFAAQINHRPMPKRVMVAVYLALFALWLWGPVFIGFWQPFTMRNDPSGWLSLPPTASLIGLIVSLICLSFVKTLPHRLHYCRVVPSLLGTLSMLGLLPYLIYSWMQ